MNPVARGLMSASHSRLSWTNCVSAIRGRRDSFALGITMPRANPSSGVGQLRKRPNEISGHPVGGWTLDLSEIAGFRQSCQAHHPFPGVWRDVGWRQDNCHGPGGCVSGRRFSTTTRCGWWLRFGEPKRSISAWMADKTEFRSGGIGKFAALAPNIAKADMAALKGAGSHAYKAGASMSSASFRRWIFPDGPFGSSSRK